MRPTNGWLVLAALTLCCAPPDAVPDGDSSPNPAIPTSGTVASIDGVPIAWTSVGQGSPTLIFVHGWSCDHTYWREQTRELATDHRVVTLDLAGHGDSGAERVVWNLESLADDVAAVAGALDLHDVVLIGHSMGGPVSLLAAAAMPNRVVGVVAVDALHDAEMEIPPEAWDEIMTAYREDWSGTCDRFVRSMFLEGAEPALVEEVTSDMCAANPEIALVLFERFPVFDAKAALSAVEVPVRAINAAGLPTAVETNRRYADYDAVIMEGVGHFLQLERPEEFNAHLRDLLAEIQPPTG